MACQRTADDPTLRQQAGAGEDDVIHLTSGPDHVTCECQEEEDRTAQVINCREREREETIPLLPTGSSSLTLTD